MKSILGYCKLKDQYAGQLQELKSIFYLTSLQDYYLTYLPVLNSTGNFERHDSKVPFLSLYEMRPSNIYEMMRQL